MTYSAITASPNISPIFIKRPLLESVFLYNEIVGRDVGSATPTLLYTGGAAGGLIEAIEVYALGANVQSVLRLFYSLPLGTGYNLFCETLLPAVAAAPADNVIAGYPVKVALPKIMFPASPNPAVPNEGLRVPAGVEIAVALGTIIDSGVVVSCFGGEFS